MRRTSRPDERGASSVESLGVIAVAALLVVGVTLGVAAYPAQISRVLCNFSQAVGFGSGGCGPVPAAAAQGKTDADFQPGVCMLSETSEKYNAEVKIWFVKLGDSSGFIVQEFSDGTVRATLTDGASMGATASLGSKTFDTDKLGDGNAAGVDVSLGADLTFEYGDTWEFDSADQWTDMKDDLDDYLIQQVQLKNDQYGGTSLWLLLSDGFLEAPKDPTVSYGKVGIEAVLEANAGVRVGTGPAKPTTPGGKGEDTFADPEAGVNLSVTAGGSVIVENDHETGQTSYTYELTGKGEVGADGVIAHVSGEGTINGAFTTTYDKDRQLVEMSFKNAYEVGVSGELGNGTLPVSGSGSVSETDSVATTTTIAIDDSNRALANEWLSFRSGATSTLSLPFSAMVPNAPSSDPFQQMLYEQAKTSQVTYHNVKDGWEFGLAVKKGWEFGFSVSAEEATATMTDADFLGAPAADGVRPMIDDSVCD